MPLLDQEAASPSAVHTELESSRSSRATDQEVGAWNPVVLHLGTPAVLRLGKSQCPCARPVK